MLQKCGAKNYVGLLFLKFLESVKSKYDFDFKMCSALYRYAMQNQNIPFAIKLLLAIPINDLKGKLSS